MQRLNRLVAVVALAVSTFPAAAQEIHAFSVQQAQEYAKKNNVQVKNAMLDVQIQEQTNRELTGTAYPQLKASGSMTYNAQLPVSLVPAEFFGGQPGTYQKVAFGTRWNSTVGASISQIVFDGQVFVGLKARSTAIDFQVKNQEITEQLIRTNIYKVYYQLIVSRTQVNIIDANIELLNSLYHDTKAMFDNGFAEKLDVDRIDVRKTNLQTEKTNVLTQIANGYLGLKVLMGMPMRDSLILTDSVTDEEVKKGLPEMGTAFDYSLRPEFQYADLGVKLGEFDVRRYQLSKMPTLTINGYYNKNAQRNTFDFFAAGGDWFGVSAFTLNLNIPIFQGFSANARIARARLQLQQYVNQRENLKLTIDNEIATAQNNFVAAVSNLNYQKSNMQLAETIYQQTKKKFEIGTGAQTEINQAQSDLVLAQTNYISSLYDAVIAKIDFMKATGRLSN